MTRPEPDSREARRRSEAAADWLARRDRGLTASEQDAFLQWLAQDPRHGEWFALHRRTVGDFGALAHWRPEHSEEANPDLLAPPVRRATWAIPIGLAAAVAIVVGAWRWHETAAEAGIVAPTAAKEVERRILADGSSVELNRGASVTAAFGSTERRVNLMQGEALFDVRKEDPRPFIVRAGNVDVRAVGTAFAVRLGPATVEVLVTEGRVALVTETESAAGRVEAIGNSHGDVAPVLSPELVAGQRATVSRTGSTTPEIVSVTSAETARLLAWQPQLLDFSSAPLEAAVREFNRRNRIQFVVGDPTLAAMPIVASIRSDNVDGFARVLAAMPGVEVERGEHEIVLRRRQ
jgi:transmembrane sensor